MNITFCIALKCTSSIWFIVMSSFDYLDEMSISIILNCHMHFQSEQFLNFTSSLDTQILTQSIFNSLIHITQNRNTSQTNLPHPRHRQPRRPSPSSPSSSKYKAIPPISRVPDSAFPKPKTSYRASWRIVEWTTGIV